MKKMTLDEVKNSQLAILDYVDKICRENNLIYYLAAGTLIGAVRHKGYIPWDDDIDLFMMRSDYEKLIDIMSLKKSNDDQFMLMSLKYTEGYYYPHIKVVDRNTGIIERYMKQVSGDGVWIDIFPLDFYDKETSPSLGKLKKLVLLHRLASQEKMIPSGNFGKDLIKNLLHLLFRRINSRAIAKKIDKISQNNKKESNKVYIGLSPAGEKDLFATEWFKEVIELEFEGRKYMAPIGYDELLKHRYGDYMCLPPENQRKSNHSYSAYWR